MPSRFASLAWVAALLMVLAACGGPPDAGDGDGPGLGEGVPINVTVTGPGTVHAPDGSECSDACTVRTPAGEPLELVAEADAGHAFVQWGGACDAFPKTCRFTPQGGESVRARFAAHALRLELSGDGEGIFRIRGGDIDTACSESCAVALSQPLNLAITYDAQGSDGTDLGPWDGPCADGAQPDYCLVQVQGETHVAKSWQGPRPPVAEDDAYTLDEDDTLQVSADDGVLANDEDRLGEGLTAERIEGPERGELDLDADGSFRYQPDADANGTDTFRYRARDGDGATSEATATLTIQPVNDPPSFTLADDEVRRDGPVNATVRIEDFARSIDPGAPDEEDQDLSFEVTREGGSLRFDASPRIDDEGTLTFDPSGFGRARFTAVLEDDEGGSSDARPFTIVVRPRLRVDVTGDGSVQSDPDGIDCPDDCEEHFEPGEDVRLDADADEGAVFEGWDGDCAGADTRCTVSMDGQRDVDAAFGPAPTPEHTLSVDVAGDGEGTVTIDPEGADSIDCSDDCTYDFDEATRLTLTARPTGDGTFDGWGGDCSGTDTCEVVMDGDRDVTATFALPPPPIREHTLTVRIRDEGRVTSEPAGIDCPGDCTTTFDEDTPVTLTATAVDDGAFAGWGGDCRNGAPECDLVMDGDKEVTATFTAPAEQARLEVVSTSGDGEGTVTSDPPGIDCPDASCAATFDVGATVTLTADPDEGSTFDRWGAPCDHDDAECKVVVDGDMKVDFSFGEGPLPVDFTVDVDGPGRVTSDPEGIDCYDDTCEATFTTFDPVTLTAEADEGTTFVGWGGACSDQEGDTCDVDTDDDRSVTARFTSDAAP